MAVLHNNANHDLMHLIWKIYYYELVTCMEKDIHVSHKGQGVTRTRVGTAPCKNGLARTLQDNVSKCSDMSTCRVLFQ